MADAVKMQELLAGILCGSRPKGALRCQAV